MKNLLATIAFCFITLSSFAQSKCSESWLAFKAGDGIIRGVEVISEGLYDAENSALYTATMTVDVPGKKASNVVLVHNPSGKRFIMSQMTTVKSLNIPIKCVGGAPNGSSGYSFKGAGTNMIVYFLVPNDGFDFRVVFYLPIGPQDLKALN